MRAHIPSILTPLLLAASVHAADGLPAGERDALEKAHAAATVHLTADPAHADVAAFVEAHYATDAKLLPPGMPVVEGRDAILAFFKALPPLREFAEKDIEVDGDGTIAYIRGSFHLVLAPPNAATVTQDGKFIEVWRKRDGAWRCVADAFNADAPDKPAP